MQLSCRLQPRAIFPLLCSAILLLAPVSRGWQATAQESVSSQSLYKPYFLELDRRTSAQMSRADAEILRQRHRQVATEAAFFGYNLSLPGWDYEQTICPPLPDQIILHYHRLSRDGAVSEFTAVIPRASGRVFVIPVLYRNATPFHPAPGSARSIDVFNRVVPAESAATAFRGKGPWLLLAACYADMAGSEANVLERAGDSIALARAPQPTLHISEVNTAPWVLFTSRDATRHYTVWQLTFNGAGRLTAAATTRFADYVSRAPSPTQPNIRVVPPAQKPSVKIVPPQKPSERTVPQ